tara:strand:+ start:949 stop:1074 length:126 start_codon:yes stop_codon:yes gene_type:complete
MNDFEQEQLVEQLNGLHELLEVLVEGCTCCATVAKKSKKEK